MSAIAPDIGEPALPARPVRARSVLVRLLHRKQALVGLAIIAIVVTCAVFAPFVAPYDPGEQFFEGLTLEGAPLPPNAQFWFGTDLLGRDLLSRLIFGAQTSLVIGVVANGIAVFIGALVGITAMVNWVQVARVLYTETRSLSEREFIEAERSLGAGSGLILWRHILPHLVSTIVVWATLGISTTVLLEATLSFLGIGVQPPTPSWGNIIFENQTYFATAPWLVFIPGAAIILLALAFNLLGDALRDILDPTQQGRAP